MVVNTWLIVAVWFPGFSKVFSHFEANKGDLDQNAKFDIFEDHFERKFCRVSETEAGVCDSTFGCKLSGGISHDAKGCGSFKVCCIHNLSCKSGEVDLRRFNFRNPSYPGSDAGNQVCSLKLRIRQDTCAIRIKLVDFYTVKLQRSSCELDKFLVLGLSRGPMDEICGNQSGHSSTFLIHPELTDRFTLTHILQSTKYRWNIEVTQMNNCSKTVKEHGTCGLRLIPPKLPANTTASPPVPIGKTRSKRKVVDIPSSYHVLPDAVTTSLISKLWGKATFQALQSNMPLASRIIKGENAVTNEFPWMVSLKIKPNTFFCGGSLISEYFVLTAAHCVDGASPGIILIEMGRIKLFDKSSIQRNVAEIMYNWNFLNSRLWYDIALLRLDQRVPLTPAIIPVCLPSIENIVAGKTMTTSGWGVVNPVLYLIATTLQKGDMKIMDITECRRRWGRFGVVINDDMLCVSDSQTPVSCNGDSGSPGVIERSDGTFEVAGVVSFGALGCFRPDLNTAVVYTKVYSYLPWLAVNMQEIEEVN